MEDHLGLGRHQRVERGAVGDVGGAAGDGEGRLERRGLGEVGEGQAAGGAAPLMRYLDVLAADTRAAIDRGLRMAEATATVAASEAENWEMFGLNNPRNATVAYAELEWE
nr:hypothetical protein [Mangrovicoccus ximenensis]